MHLIVRYASGRRVEALLLAFTHDIMRIVVHRRNDSLELRLRDDQWLSETGKHLEIEAIVAVA